MPERDFMVIFSIDTGNDKIKTEGNVIQAGLKKLDYIPESTEEALYYSGEYYMETVERLSYMYDKTADDRYYILTLLALALGALFYGHRLSAGLILLDILYISVYTVMRAKRKAAVRICRRCGAKISKKRRGCPSCGKSVKRTDTEWKLAEMIEGEEEGERRMPQELERDFERIEEMNVEKALAYGEEDIEGILMEKMKQDDAEEG